MRVLIVTDAFPPRCGGSGWSTYHLARALTRAGHLLRIVKPQAGLSGTRRVRYDDLEVEEFGYFVRDVPYLRNVLRDDVLGSRLRDFLVADLARRPCDVVHAQHVLSAAPAVAAARTAAIPAVVTVRDYWPVCYFTTLHVVGERCPTCSLGKMLRCMKEKSPRAYWAGAPLIPYMRRAVRRRQQSLRAAQAVVAVSRHVADIAVRPIVGDCATHVIPNLVELEQVARASEPSPAASLPGRFLLFVGKLNALKGAWLLLDILGRIRHPIPLVMVGDGDERVGIERTARERRLDVRFVPWVENEEVLRIMRRAAVLLVPSLWDEPLSRTVIEAMAVGVPVVATDRGGIHDQIVHGESGMVIAPRAEELAAAVDALLDEPATAERYVAAARERVRTRFDGAVVLPQIESLYREVAARARAR